MMPAEIFASDDDLAPLGGGDFFLTGFYIIQGFILWIGALPLWLLSTPSWPRGAGYLCSPPRGVPSARSWAASTGEGYGYLDLAGSFALSAPLGFPVPPSSSP